MKKFLSYRQLSEYLEIKVSTLYSLVSRHQVPHHRLSGRMVRFSVEEIDDWLSSKRCPIEGAGQSNGRSGKTTTSKEGRHES
jgi:excisionase family DNA binding protein